MLYLCAYIYLCFMYFAMDIFWVCAPKNRPQHVDPQDRQPLKAAGARQLVSDHQQMSTEHGATTRNMF